MVSPQPLMPYSGMLPDAWEETLAGAAGVHIGKGPMRRFGPPARALALILTGDARAVVSYGMLTTEGGG